ncbi:MAG: hypothetical protein K1X72_05330 [Pyrinomonadaceae bacterium]|nr:hypothetical protein [Pyrinomonadaceae bacterium]
MAINFSFSQSGNSHFAQVIGNNDPKFLVGKETAYKGNEGLYNYSIPDGMAYSAENYKNEFGFWAYFIAPTAKAESNNSFICLNTYDRAKFTFSFMQYAAHVPNGDFVVFFKKLLTLNNAGDYFPKLVLQNNRIFYRNTNGTLTQLENDDSTQGLMNYLNPTLTDIDNQELICAARFVHWARNDANHRRIQVETAIEHFKQNMKSYSRSFNLDGFPAKVCQVICDILHQGRAKNRHIITAINTNGNFDRAYNNLLELGRESYPERVRTVRTVINNLATVFEKTYNQAANDFV